MLDYLEDAWDMFLEGLEYIFTFEWWGDVADLLGSAFEDIGEFSFFGLAFGILGVAFSFGTRYFNLNGTGMGIIESMTQFMPPFQRIMWTVLSYVGAFIGGYIMGKYFENS